MTMLYVEGEDPNSELAIQRRYRWMLENMGKGRVRVPRSWVGKDPAMDRMIAEGHIDVEPETDHDGQ